MKAVSEITRAAIAESGVKLKQQSKYSNRPTTLDGYRFASLREAGRYTELRLLLTASQISDLELQPRYPLIVGGVKIAVYVADFRYVDRRTGATVVEDVKGVRTPVYRLKKLLLLACYGIEVVEV